LIKQDHLGHPIDEAQAGVKGRKSGLDLEVKKWALEERVIGDVCCGLISCCGLVSWISVLVFVLLLVLIFGGSSD